MPKVFGHGQVSDVLKLMELFVSGDTSLKQTLEAFSDCIKIFVTSPCLLHVHFTALRFGLVNDDR